MDHQAFDLLKEAINEIRTDVKTLGSDVVKIKNDIGHYKGFIGGIVFCFTVAWTGVTYFLTRKDS